MLKPILVMLILVAISGLIIPGQFADAKDDPVTKEIIDTTADLVIGQPSFVIVTIENTSQDPISLGNATINFDTNPDKVGQQPLIESIDITIQSNEQLVLALPLVDINGEPVKLQSSLTVSVDYAITEDSPRGGDEPKIKKKVSKTTLKVK